VPLGLVSGCAGPEGAQFAPSPEAAIGPRPALGPTAPFRGELAAAGPAVERLAAGGEALGARAEAVQARAAGLAGPVVDPARRERMVAAAEAAAAGPEEVAQP
jgi:hypothetical protein